MSRQRFTAVASPTGTPQEGRIGTCPLFVKPALGQNHSKIFYPTRETLSSGKLSREIINKIFTNLLPPLLYGSSCSNALGGSLGVFDLTLKATLAEIAAIQQLAFDLFERQTAAGGVFCPRHIRAMKIAGVYRITVKLSERLNAHTLVALVGVAPFIRESGAWKGQRGIAGGRSQIRNVLYMSSLVAVRRNAVLKAFHLQLRTRGKSGKQALTARMRKLIVILNAMIKHQTPWAVHVPVSVMAT